MRTIVTELGEEKRCTRCGDYWPADGEFFGHQPNNRNGLSSQCRACLAESRRESRQRTGRMR